MTIRQASSRSGAFTLIELIVVIAIIAILTGIVLASLSGSKAKSRDVKRISDIGQLQLALSLYYDKCRQYPAQTGPAGTVDPNSSCTSNGQTVKITDFISSIPTPPSSPLNQTQYDYAVLIDLNSGSIIDYVLHIQLENYSDSIKDGLSSDYFTNPAPRTVWFPILYSCSNKSPSTDYCKGSK